ncbi:hypothetical protein [Actinacidiphila sp. ITFR-21]|uniref:hypothetical protein n=1 Tax=Actinacidiphila sp. ITFR-21 TaxID=3075199 RepID=UPI0028899ABD|nr:hypothetical protein [Streptomyces sp. ITFR-21]WNI18523.1 hypothetical protein RLT57_25320 [Streptomyces sp. ITFR-21]
MYAAEDADPQHLRLPEPGAVVLLGDLARPDLLTVGALRGWPERAAEVGFECSGSGTRRHRFQGPLLYDVLTAAGPAFGPGGRRERLRFPVTVTGRDGHRALLSWAEIDPDFGGAPVLPATRIDGVPLGAAGPQPVLPQDRRGARHISGITAVGVEGYLPAR